ncbi:MAG: terminase large subunit [Actinomycetota bacterium]|nr:terminase large subunit [Actinomycetota bacterium]
MSAALDVLAALVLSSGQLWGEVATAWQWADARAILVGDRRLAYITRPRGASKTTDLAGVAVAALVEQLPPNSRSYAVAADRDQAALLLDAIAGFVSRTPGLRSLLKVDSWKVTNTRTAATLEVLAADAAGAFGLLPHLVIVDERAQWKTTPEPERLWRALFSALPKVKGSRLVILTTAGDPAHPAGKLIKRARVSPRWYVSELPGPCPWADPDDLAEQREELPEWEFERLHMNRWTASADRLTSAADLAHCVTLDGPLPYDKRWTYAVGVDLATKHDRSVVVVCHREPILARLANSQTLHNDRAETLTGHRIILDRIQVWQGTRAQPLALSLVENFVSEVSDRYGQPPVIMDPYQAIGMMQRLVSRGVRAREFTFSAQSVGRLGQTLHNLIRGHQLAIPDDPELIDELENVRLRETSPGVVRMDHDAGRHDDRAVALALAANHLLEVPEQVLIKFVPAPYDPTDLRWAGF